MFLRNQWYVAATDHEIGQRPFGRMILGEPIVFYRAEDGTPVALEDRCPHRRLPLSMGKLVDGVLQCHYHGLRFDQGGFDWPAFRRIIREGQTDLYLSRCCLRSGCSGAARSQ